MNDLMIGLVDWEMGGLRKGKIEKAGREVEDLGEEEWMGKVL